MRWSIATKIFLGFAAMILAFGSVGLFGIWQMQGLRRNVQLVRKGVLPLTERLASLLRELEGYEKELSGAPQGDLIRLRSFFPNFKPFDGVARAEETLRSLRTDFTLGEGEAVFLDGLVLRLHELRTGSELRSGLQTTSPKGVASQVLGEHPSTRQNQAAYEALARAFVQRLHQEKLTEAWELREELVVIVRRVQNEVVHVRREVRRFVALVERNAQVTESSTMLMVSVSMGVALLAAVLVMIWAGLTLRPLRRLREGTQRVAQGDFVTVSITTRDELGQLADDFNRMATSLAERNRLLVQRSEELRRAERLATIGRMSSQITHEIRNPLSSIGLNTEMLEDELANLEMLVQSGGLGGEDSVAEARSLLGAIRGEIERLTVVTEQYLRFARLPRPTLAASDLNALLGDLLGFMSGEMAAQNVRHERDLDPELPLVALDANQIRQAVLNLLRNSIEALCDGGVVQVATRRANGEQVELTVKDNGPGIDPAAQERIFEPFFSTKASGTGLGLALVQQIVTDHGGTIACESTEGQGTVFRIRLQVDTGAAPEEE